MVTLQAKNLTLEEVHQYLKLQRSLARPTYGELLRLEAVTEFERQEIEQIRLDFQAYWQAGKVLESQIQLLVVGPLLRLAGFYRTPINLTLEQAMTPGRSETIAEIEIVDDDRTIGGRLDLLAAQRGGDTPFWILVVESKNSQVEALNGLPQLLTYATEGLKTQEAVWGLTTNGISYYFVQLLAGAVVRYQLLPELNLFDPDRSLQLLQVLKAICGQSSHPIDR
jgi:hypothetical protein